MACTGPPPSYSPPAWTGQTWSITWIAMSLVRCIKMLDVAEDKLYSRHVHDETPPALASSPSTRPYTSPASLTSFTPCLSCATSHS